MWISRHLKTGALSGIEICSYCNMLIYFYHQSPSGRDLSFWFGVQGIGKSTDWPDEDHYNLHRKNGDRATRTYTKLKKIEYYTNYA